MYIYYYTTRYTILFGDVHLNSHQDNHHVFTREILNQYRHHKYVDGQAYYGVGIWLESIRWPIKYAYYYLSMYVPTTYVCTIDCTDVVDTRTTVVRD